MRVTATREGLVGRRTATGHRITPQSLFVALPSTTALRHMVIVRYPTTGRVVRVPVWDVGPWNEHDDAYVFGGKRPQAESGKDRWGRKTNGAGIDLSDAVAAALGFGDIGIVEWQFDD